MSRTKNALLSLATFALLTAFGCGEAVPQQASIKINRERKFQTIIGWEATAQAGESYSKAFENYKEKLFDAAVNDLGINRLRLEVRSGAENPHDFFSDFAAGKINEEEWRSRYYEIINDNDDPLVINPKGFNFSELDSTIENIVLPIRKRLAARGESLFVNLNYIDFAERRDASDTTHYQNSEEYAEFMLAAFQHMKSKYGFAPDAIEVILEPDNTTGWTATHIGQVIVAAAKRLEANGFKATFIVPATTNAANAPIYIDEIARVPEAMRYISEFAYHRYCCASPEVLQRIVERADKYGKQTAMLEWIGADHNTLHEDLKIGRNSAWQQYTLAFNNQPDNGAQYFLIDDTDVKKPIVKLGSRSKFLSQYFRYIRSGARRVGAETSNKNFDPLAFLNSNGKSVVVIKTDAPGTIAVENLPAGKYGIVYTTAKETAVAAPDALIAADGILSAKIPAAGILTIYAK